jgi:Ca2+-transporting ATPase
MASPPRHGTQLFDWRTWSALGFVGLLVGGATLAAFGAGRAFGGDVAQTMAFATLALSELALVFAMRAPQTHFWRLPLNRWLVGSVAASAAVVAAVIYVPAAHDAVATVPLTLPQALVSGTLALVPVAVVEAAKAVTGRRRFTPARVDASGSTPAEVAR